MESLIFIDYISTDTGYSLALEEALAGALKPGDSGFFMMNQNGMTALVARYQDLPRAVNLAETARMGIPVLRRLSGGGASLQDLGVFNFSFIFPPDKALPEAITLLSPLAEILAEHGLGLEMSGRNNFSIPGHGKITGISGYRLPGGQVVAHCPLLFDVSLSFLADLFPAYPAGDRGAAHHPRTKLTMLKEHLPMGMAGFWMELHKAFERRIRKSAALPPKLDRAAHQIVAARYSQNYWNIGPPLPTDIRLARRFSFGSLELHLGVKKNLIAEARLTGDFITPLDRDNIPIFHLEELLLDLPADHPETWAEAWAGVDFSRVFHGQADVGEIIRRLIEDAKEAGVSANQNA